MTQEENKINVSINKEIGIWQDYYAGNNTTLREIILQTAIHFTNLQKEQMMKDAKPADINYWNQRGLSIHFDESLERLGFEEDDKVKVIIIKEDEK